MRKAPCKPGPRAWPDNFSFGHSVFIFRCFINLMFPSVGMVDDTRVAAAFSRLLLAAGNVEDDPGNNAGGNAGGGGGEVGEGSERRVGVAPRELVDWLPGGRGDGTGVLLRST